MQRAHSSSFLTTFILVIFVNIGLTPAAGPEQTVNVLKKELEMNFLKIYENFEIIAGSEEIKSSKLKKIDGYFINCLKYNQIFYSLIRTNSKGTVISEVVRGKSPKRKFRKVNRQRVFTIPAIDKSAYKTLVRAKTGRYYFLWSTPVFMKKSQGREKFSGVVIAKVDFWDGCHEFSKTTDTPFKILMGRKTLYNHKWDNMEGYITKSLSLPGSKNLFIRSEKTIVASDIPTDTPVQTQAAAAPKSDPPQPKTPDTPKTTAVEEPVQKPAGPTLFTTKSKTDKTGFSFTYIGVAAIAIAAILFGILLLRQSKREKESIL
jgi:hypothetical protein